MSWCGETLEGMKS